MYASPLSYIYIRRHRRTGPVSFRGLGLRSLARIFSPALARKSIGFAAEYY